MGWQRLTLPPSHPGSTISARELNDRVRDGTGWTLTALATNTRALFSQRLRHHIDVFLLAFRRRTCASLGVTLTPPTRSHIRSPARGPASPHEKRYRPRPLVPVGSRHCCPSTSGLSNWSSSSGLTRFHDEESHLEVSFPLRCFQRLSAPEIATRPCRWHDNRHTSAPSTPVLSY